MKIKLRRIFAVGMCMAGSVCFDKAAIAQTAQSFAFDTFRPQTLIVPTIPTGYDRGGNVSIDEQYRPNYMALPVHLGSFDLYPEVDTFIGGSSNVLLSRSNPKPDMLVGATISLYAIANWGNSNFTFNAKDYENVWVHNAVRSQDQGRADAVYQIDVTDSLQAAVEGGFNRYGDNNVIGTSNNLGSVLLTTQLTTFAARLQYVTGHFSQIISIDRNHYEEDPVYSEITGLQQSYYFDHSFIRITAQTEYALSPNMSVFGQFSTYKTTYANLLPNNLPNTILILFVPFSAPTSTYQACFAARSRPDLAIEIMIRHFTTLRQGLFWLPS